MNMLGLLVGGISSLLVLLLANLFEIDPVLLFATVIYICVMQIRFEK